MLWKASCHLAMSRLHPLLQPYMLVTGAGSVACGGPSSLSVYSFDDNPLELTITPLGCFKDDFARRLPVRLPDSSSNSMTECGKRAFEAGATVAGLQCVLWASDGPSAIPIPAFDAMPHHVVAVCTSQLSHNVSLATEQHPAQHVLCCDVCVGVANCSAGKAVLHPCCIGADTILCIPHQTHTPLVHCFRYGAECWVGTDATFATGLGSSTDCTFPCPSNSSETCGGPLANNLFSVASPLPTPAPVYLGCFKDSFDRRLPMMLSATMTNSRAECAAMARGAKVTIAGTQWVT